MKHAAVRRFITPDRLIASPGAPLIDPAEAIAIALTTSKVAKNSFSPDGLVVRLVLQALSRSGWKIVPRETRMAT
jgi:hypothetical protein